MGKRRNFRIVLVAYLVTVAFSFIVPLSSFSGSHVDVRSSLTTTTTISLQAARRSGAKPTSGKAKKKSNVAPKAKKGPAGPTPKQMSRASQMNQKKKQSSHSPPWQVVSKKDMAKNIQAERKRRELAQTEGIHNVKEEISFTVSKSFLSNEDKALLAWKRFSHSPQDEIDFIGAYLDKQLPPRIGAPEVAFLGRSNVGKSSLLNQLVNSDMARVGKTPGATASVNLYGMFRKEKAILGLVDLPGFGYAKLSKDIKESVQETAENYLEKRRELMLGVLLVDIRRVPSDDDRAVLAALFDMGVPLIVVATKVDKLSKTQAEDSLRVIQEGLGLPEGQPFSVSSVTGEGVKELWRIIMEACEGGVAELKEKMEKGQDMSLAPASTEDFEDNEDFVYSQGFDWVHDSSTELLEDGVEYYRYGEGGDEDFDEEEEEFLEDDIPVVDKQSLKYLRQKAKDMEKRGEL